MNNSEIKLNESTRYTGTYDGINFLISLHGVGEEYRPKGTWCYYLYVNEKQIPTEYRKDFVLDAVFDEKVRLSHNYMSSELADIHWHGGITFYSKEGGADGEPLVIKMGCDFAHYFDEDHSYDKNSVLTDVIASINSLWNKYPDLKIFSSLYGGYCKKSEGEFNKYGDFQLFEEKLSGLIENE